jgi:hypothetical protein
MWYLDEGGNDGHLVEHLDTRLYEGGPLGIEAETIDESLGVCTRLVLGLTRLRTHTHTHTHAIKRKEKGNVCESAGSNPELVLESVHSRLLEGVVVTAVGVELLLRVEVHDVGHHLHHAKEITKGGERC